jgi:ABC-2 type transport system ATP-binding protein
MLSIQGLTKTYRTASVPALAGVSFSVAEGGFVALLGPNGAGKSTLINILSGRADADAGTIRLRGEPLGAGTPRLRALIGIVPQEVRFDYVFSVEELLRLELGFYGLRRDDAHIDGLLSRLSLAQKRHERVRSLSGGMLRRLMIARALVHRPPLLLLDEPTAGVDLHLRRDLHAFLRELNAAGTTIVLTTHYLEEAEQLCERVILLDRGRVVADEVREAFLKMAGDFLTVDIRTDAAGRLARLFAADGAVSVAQTGSGVRIVVPGSSRASLLRKLSEAAPEIDSLEILKPRLEEVFVKLTGKGGRAHAGAH